MSFIIVICSRCSGFFLAMAKHKTRTCPYCGFRVDIRKAKKLASAKTAREASLLLQNLKKNNSLRRGSVSRL